MILGAIFIVVFIIVAFIGGVVTGGQRRPTTIDAGTSSAKDCDGACLEWEARRGETCAAKRQTAMFQATVDATSARLAAATVTHLALVAAAVAAAFIPFVGGAIAVGLAALAAIALTTVSVLAGQLVSQSDSLASAKRMEMDAAARQEAARQKILANCPPDKASQCLSHPAPC